MADDKTFDEAEKAYAAAAAEVKPAKAETPAAAEVAAPVQAVAPKIEKKKPAVRKRVVKAAPVKKAPRVTKPAVRARVAKVAALPQRTIKELKEAIMTKTTTTDFAKPLADVYGEFQTRAQDAYTKGTAALTEATEFAKGNVEAIVEASKIFAAGVQGFGKSYVEEAKTAYETATADVKELAAVKSPTELFQLQGKIARRNFDALVATSSKNTDALLKLANDAFAPLSGRVNLAAEKLAKVA